MACAFLAPSWIPSDIRVDWPKMVLMITHPHTASTTRPFDLVSIPFPCRFYAAIRGHRVATFPQGYISSS
jgi:hypothetical protein